MNFWVIFHNGIYILYEKWSVNYIESQVRLNNIVLVFSRFYWFHCSIVCLISAGNRDFQMGVGGAWEHPHMWCDLGESVGSRTRDIFSFLFDWSNRLEMYILLKTPLESVQWFPCYEQLKILRTMENKRN